MLQVNAALLATPAVNNVVFVGKFVVTIPLTSTFVFISKILHSIWFELGAQNIYTS
jgi:hypothetical protein